MILDTSIDPKPQPRRTRAFRKRDPIVRFTPDQSQRQNDLIRRAWQSLSSKEAVIAFLNTANDDIGGEPLALALASQDGLMSAQRLLEAMDGKSSI